MSRQEEVIQEFVREQLDELGVAGEACSISFVPAKGRKKAQVVMSFTDEDYDEVCEVLYPYLPDLAEDFTYTFSGSVSYKIHLAGDDDCNDSDSSDDLEDFISSSEMADDYDDVDDPTSQYEEEGLVITSIDDDGDYYLIDGDEDDEYDQY